MAVRFILTRTRSSPRTRVAFSESKGKAAPRLEQRALLVCIGFKPSRARVSTKEAFQSAMISQFGSLFRAWREAGEALFMIRPGWSMCDSDWELQGLDPTGRDRLSWGEFTHVFRLPGTHT